MPEPQLEASTYLAATALDPVAVESLLPTVVRLAGELDIATAPRTAQVLGAALTLDDVVVVDLRELLFIDVVGVRVIADASVRSRADGKRLVVVRGAVPVDRVFALTEADALIEFVDLGPFEPPACALEPPPSRGADGAGVPRALSLVPPAAAVAAFTCCIDEELEAHVEARLRKHLAVLTRSRATVWPEATVRASGAST